ncbi:MAG: 4-hydroxybenzoate octaprenyltransferase [Rhodospirillales bacterium]|nr:4-hydroxybenzoate octaprenyltransferase [Rhodospirillales bacterium]
MTQATDRPASDIPTGTWIDRLAPAPARPYLRLIRVDRPIGTWLLLFPCWWSVSLAAEGPPDLRLMVLFAVGALIMRGAGCVLNDIADRDFDYRVARTRARPIASGEISVPRAYLFLAALLLAGLAVLVQFNPFAVALGVASLPLVAFYPYAKRFTHWPQAVLGLTFNWGALLGWAAVRGGLDPAALALYAGGVFWTLGYDTIYAHQDKEDDALVGIKSTALRLGAATRPWLFAFYGAAIVLFAFAGQLAQTAWPFFAALALAGLHLLWQAGRADLDDPAACLATFRSNRVVGWIMLLGIVAARVLPPA